MNPLTKKNNRPAPAGFFMEFSQCQSIGDK